MQDRESTENESGKEGYGPEASSHPDQDEPHDGGAGASKASAENESDPEGTSQPGQRDV